MRQAIMTKPGDIQFRQVAEPQPGSGEVLLHIRRIGVCGSDIHVWHGKHPFTQTGKRKRVRDPNANGPNANGSGIESA